METLRTHLQEGQVIPAQPLALDSERKFSEKHQRAITRYYLDSGVGGLAVGVHSTQFEIREPQHDLFRPVLELAEETIAESLLRQPRGFAKIAGICGGTAQAVNEATLARGLGYDAGLLSLGAMAREDEHTLVAHCRSVSEVIPIIGFYLQPAVGGRVLSFRFWRQFAEIPNAVAIKIAPFNRYQTLDVVRAVVESGREDLILYTGNDDTIVSDLLTPFIFEQAGRKATRRIAGGLLGHWGVWTHAAVRMFRRIKEDRDKESVSREWLATAVAVTDMNAAVFDAANRFAGCIPGILEVLRRQGLTPTNLCLNPHEVLSEGQAAELDRVSRAYPELTDDDFIRENLHRWLA
jgi:dihydrodipicolinate synthase/N-acetylneuraminate lyase